MRLSCAHASGSAQKNCLAGSSKRTGATALEPTPACRPARRGVAAVELALALPLLLFFFLVAIDFGRVSYGSVTASNSARNGAWHAAYYSTTGALNESSYTSAGTAAAADGTNVSVNAASDVASTQNATDKTVTVTVTHHFRTVSTYFQLADPYNVQRKIVMPQIPIVPVSSAGSGGSND